MTAITCKPDSFGASTEEVFHAALVLAEVLLRGVQNFQHVLGPVSPHFPMMQDVRPLLRHDLLVVFVPLDYGLGKGAHDARHLRLDTGTGVHQALLRLYLRRVCHENERVNRRYRYTCEK